MTPQAYIQSELQHCTDYALTPEDQALLDKQGVEAFIYAKLTSKKFRKWAVDESSEQQAKRAIHLNVSQNKSLQFRYPFGGYKLWSMPGSPQVDWAEFFAIAYYCKYIAPVAAAYKPGVEFLFGSDDVIIERMDNIPTADTDAYFASFKKLLGEFQKYFPANFKMDIVRIGDLYPDKDVFEQELADNIVKVTQDYATSVDERRKKKMYASSELNIRWDGAKDLTMLSDADRQSVIKMGPIYHDAYCGLSRRRDFNRGDDKIVIFTMVIPNAIAVGTTKTSVTKYWTGFGILERSAEILKPRILSPTQLQELEGHHFELVPTNLFDLSNFHEVRVYQK